MTRQDRSTMALMMKIFLEILVKILNFNDGLTGLVEIIIYAQEKTRDDFF